MRGKRSGEIYDEIMGAIRAESLKENLTAAREKAEVIVNPHLKWV